LPGQSFEAQNSIEWEEDSEVGGEFHTRCDADGVQAGLSRMTKAPEKPIPFKSSMRETIIVLECAVRIEIARGPTLELKKGDMASLPNGAESLWHVTAPFEQMWVMA